MDPARPEIMRVHARAGSALIEDHEFFALFKAPERRRQRANIHGLRRHIEQVVEHPADLAIQHAHIFAAPRHGDAGQLFSGHAEGVLLIHRRDVVEAVEIADALEIGLVLEQFLGAAVKQADMRIDALDNLAVQLQHQAQHAVRSRVLRTEIDREIAFGLAGFDHVISHAQPPFWPSWAFSSPGMMYLAPSHGLMKSKSRYSWTSSTGS